MRVICICNKNDKDDFCERLLIEGISYTAYQCSTYSHCYSIKEIPLDPNDGNFVSFAKRRFIPLSTIDETELLEQRQNQLQEI